MFEIVRLNRRARDRARRQAGAAGRATARVRRAPPARRPAGRRVERGRRAPDARQPSAPARHVQRQAHEGERDAVAERGLLTAAAHVHGHHRLERLRPHQLAQGAGGEGEADVVDGGIRGALDLAHGVELHRVAHQRPSRADASVQRRGGRRLRTSSAASAARLNVPASRDAATRGSPPSERRRAPRAGFLGPQRDGPRRQSRRPGAGGASHGTGSSATPFGSTSNSSWATSTADRPSTSAWWILATIPQRRRRSAAPGGSPTAAGCDRAARTARCRRAARSAGRPARARASPAAARGWPRRSPGPPPRTALLHPRRRPRQPAAEARDAL